mgnify:FL=1
MDEHTVEIGLDYAVPSYRDFKSAEYYFNKASERIAAGSSLTFYQASAVTEHQRYLERLGFEPVETSPGGLKKYRKVIAGR